MLIPLLAQLPSLALKTVIIHTLVPQVCADCVGRAAVMEREQIILIWKNLKNSEKNQNFGGNSYLS